MKIGDWKATGRFNERFQRIRDLGLESHLAELEAYGFTIVEPDLVAPLEQTERIRDAMLSVAEERTGVKHELDKPGDRGTYAAEPLHGEQFILYYLGLKDPAFTETLRNPASEALTSYLLSGDYRLSVMTGFVKWGDSYGKELGIHADSPAGIRGELPPVHPLVVNVTWTLTDYSKENGALAIVPGSHRLAHRPARGGPIAVGHHLMEAPDAAIPVEAPAGSLIIWNGNTWHGAYPKTTTGLRLTLVSVFCRPHMLPQEDYRPRLTPEVTADLDYRTIEMLGGFEDNNWSDERGPRYSEISELRAAAKT